MKTIGGQTLLGFGTVSLECALGLLKPESPALVVKVIGSPFPHVRGFGKGEAKCEHSGKGNKCGTGERNLLGHGKPETLKRK